MFFEILSTHLRLQKWRQNPTATKREIGVVSWWLTADAANDQALSAQEIQRMKKFLRAHAPSSFARLFHEKG